MGWAPLVQPIQSVRVEVTDTTRAVRSDPERLLTDAVEWRVQVRPAP